MNGRQALQREEESGCHVGQRQILLSDYFNFFHGLVGLSYFIGDFFCFSLESLKSLDQLIVLENVALRLSELIQELIFKLPKFDSEFSLELDDVVSLLVYLWSLFLQEYV